MPIYLDHAAGAPLSSEAAEAMAEWMSSGLGNPSGSHSVARQAKARVEDAREVVAAFLGVEPGGVVFTSGGTEADNQAVLGPILPGAGPAPGAGAVVVSAVEHPAVLEAARAAGRAGVAVRSIGVDPDGLVDIEAMRKVLDGGVSVVSVQTANHETGVVQPVEELGRRIKKWAPGAVFHTDAVQAAAWLDLPSATRSADLVSISGHKIGGPQGVGALGIRAGVDVGPIIHGGGQERERRSGTLNAMGLVGLAAAVEATVRDREVYCVEVGRLRDLLAQLIVREVPGAVRTAGTGAGAPVLPGHCHFRFPGVESEALLFLLDEKGVCASAGAACASGAIDPSPVLLAMGVDKREAAGALRLTLGPTTTEADVRLAAAAVADAVRRLQAA